MRFRKEVPNEERAFKKQKNWMKSGKSSVQSLYIYSIIHVTTFKRPCYFQTFNQLTLIQLQNKISHVVSFSMSF